LIGRRGIWLERRTPGRRGRKREGTKKFINIRKKKKKGTTAGQA